MLVVLLASLLTDPLILLLLLNTVARSQVNTSYSSLFAINLAIGVLGLAGAIFTIPIQGDPVPAASAAVCLFGISAFLISRMCTVSLPRSVLVTACFFGYKYGIALGLLHVLELFGVQPELQSFALESLNDSELPPMAQWFLDNAFWFHRP